MRDTPSGTGRKAYGLGVKPHGNGLVLHDLHSKDSRLALKASAVDRALSAKRLQERFGEYRPYRSLRQIQEHSRYQGVPLHRSPERGELYAKYQAGIEIRKTRLQAIKEREDVALAAIRQQWEAKRREIESMGIAKRNRRNLLALARKHEAEALAKAKLELSPEREAVRWEVPYTSWQDFLKLEAGNGNEVALAVLRSRKEVTELEQAQEHKPPVKSWMDRGSEYAAKTAIRAEYAEKERELQERHDISTKGKRQLQAFLRMEQITDEARAGGLELGEVNRRIDGKGIVIFTLGSGGTIRDTGKEIFFSAHDTQARRTAKLYAEKKWGKMLIMEKGHNIFLRERELEHPQQAISRTRQGLSR